MSNVARILVVAGSIAILIGAVDPVEGVFLIFPGSAMIALGAYLAQTPRRRLVYAGCLLVATGFVAVLIASFVFHGISGAWLLVLLPYPAGWIVDVIGVALILPELFTGSWGRVAAGVYVAVAAGLVIMLSTVIVRAYVLAP